MALKDRPDLLRELHRAERGRTEEGQAEEPTGRIGNRFIFRPFSHCPGARGGRPPRYRCGLPMARAAALPSPSSIARRTAACCFTARRPRPRSWWRAGSRDRDRDGVEDEAKSSFRKCAQSSRWKARSLSIAAARSAAALVDAWIRRRTARSAFRRAPRRVDAISGSRTERTSSDWRRRSPSSGRSILARGTDGGVKAVDDADGQCLADLDEPLQFEPLRRLAHDGTAHSEPAGDIALGGQQPVDGELSAPDRPGEPVGDLLDEGVCLRRRVVSIGKTTLPLTKTHESDAIRSCRSFTLPARRRRRRGNVPRRTRGTGEAGPAARVCPTPNPAQIAPTLLAFPPSNGC